ncbi:MAG: PAS domain S-box protein [Flavobacteriales bacterium]|nr:PAS domain S-box protein [Flavobacteriales bacterium]
MSAADKINHKLIKRDETLFRNLFENNRDGIYITALDGSIIDVNQAALEITGFQNKREFANQNTIDLYVDPKQRKSFQKIIKKNGYVQDFEVLLRKKTGEKITCLLTSSVIKDSKDRVIGYQGIIRDVTLQQRQQRIQETLLRITQAATSSGDLKSLLKNLHKELKQLINVDNFYVALYDEGTEAYSFPYYVDEYDLLNELESYSLKKSLTDYIRRTEEALFVDQERRSELKKKGEAVMIGTIPKLWLGSPLITSKGVIGVVVVQSYSDPKMYTRDDLELLEFVSGQIARVIEQKQAGESIRRSEQRFKDLFEGSPDAIFVETLEGLVLDVNPAACKMHGLTYAEIVGNSYINLIPEKLRGEIKSNFENFFGEDLVSLESHSLGRNGNIIPVEIKVSHIDYGGKKVLLLHVRDVSSRKEAEEELRNSHEQLRHLSAHLHSIKEEESKRIARDLHDSLGQILTALKFDISLLNKQLIDQFPTNQYRPLKRKTKSMISKVDATIDAMRRISANLRPVVLDDIGLNAAIEWLATDFRRRTSLGMKVNIGSEEELITDHEVATTLYRILQEALTNIIRHSKARNVQVSLIRTSKDIVLTIDDDGKGIAKEKLKKATSFGLVGIQERVLGLEGVFEIKGKKGIGTKLTVSIPITT